MPRTIFITGAARADCLRVRSALRRRFRGSVIRVGENVETPRDGLVVVADSASAGPMGAPAPRVLENRIERAEFLLEVTRLVSRSESLDRLLNDAANRCLNVLGDTVFVILLEGERPWLECAASTDPDRLLLLLKSLVNLDHQAFQAGVGMLSASGEPLVIDDLTQLQRPVEASRLANQFGFKSVLATPIQRDEATYGIFLALHSSESFTDVQAGLAQGVSSALASAIANARLVNQLEQKANTDALTGLYNARFFSDVLTREVARAERHRVPLTMLMLDVDDFKQINDVYGHPVGNEVLKSLSRILQLAVRMTDFVFRCGGDEFGVVLPDTDVDGGFHVGEHIRRRVETSDLVAGGNSRMTVSVGVSQYELGIGVDALMKRADEALYRAKRGLKNSVEIYRPGSFSEAV